MRAKHLAVATTVVALALWGARAIDLDAQSSEALTGFVSSQEEGAMEGVLVTVRGEGANHTVTVVSDAQVDISRTSRRASRRSRAPDSGDATDALSMRT
jgi:hypothetical protein